MTNNIIWVFNENRTLAETVINGIHCVVFQGSPDASGHSWYYRAGTDVTTAASSRVGAFKACLTAVAFIERYAPEWSAA